MARRNPAVPMVHRNSPPFSPERTGSRRRRTLTGSTLGLLGALLTSACAGDSVASSLAVTVLSGRPDMVTGGDALLRIATPAASTDDLTITLNGTDVAAGFAPDPAGGALVGGIALVGQLNRHWEQVIVNQEKALQATFSGVDVASAAKRKAQQELDDLRDRMQEALAKARGEE